jgi:methyl-accepting chemotaxis protein
MLGWFQGKASLALKLDLAFGALSLMIALAGGAAGGECMQLFNASHGGPPALVHATKQLSAVVLGSATLLFLASVVIGWVVSRTVSTPLVTLVSRLEDLACGDLEGPIDFAHHEDEAGRLSRSMHMLAAQAKDVSRLRAECDERGRLVAVLLDAYYRLAAPGAGKVAANASNLQAIETALAIPAVPDDASDLRRLLNRLGGGHASPAERDCA